MIELLESIFSVGTFIAGTVSVVLGLLVFFQDPQRTANRYFLVFAALTGLWAGGSSIMESILDPLVRDIATTIAYTGGVLMPALALLYAKSEGRGVLRISDRYVVSVMTIPFFFVAILLVAPSLIVTLETSRSIIAYQKDFGMLYPFYMLYCTAYGMWTFVLFLEKYRNSAGIFRSHMRVIASAALISSLIAVIANLFLPWYGFFDLYWFGPLALLVALLIIGFKIAKYHHWNVKLLATEFFVSVIGLTLLVQTFLSATSFDLIINFVIFAIVAVTSYFLITSVAQELESGQEVEKLVKELAEKNTQLQELDKRKSQFVSIAAHHLKDPITAIKGYASLLLEGSYGKNLKKETVSALEKIYESSERLVAIVADFMDISNIEKGEMYYAMDDMCLLDLVEDILEEMQIPIERSGLQVDMTTDGKEGYPIIGDRRKVRQVISNLIDNALKYTQEGSVTVDLRYKDEDYITVSIIDTGIGMSQETIGQLFKKFSRAEGVAKVFTDGSGLGLYVAKEILREHNASIEAASGGLGLGSSFVITFKQAEKDNQEVCPPQDS